MTTETIDTSETAFRARVGKGNAMTDTMRPRGGAWSEARHTMRAILWCAAPVGLPQRAVVRLAVAAGRIVPVQRGVAEPVAA